MKKIQISAVIITYNEEKNIARSLDSLLKVADEIVIVDSFSKDKTKEICLGYPSVKFIENSFIGFIEQKNFAFAQANYNYILSLDADEVLTKELEESILLTKGNWVHDQYQFNRLTVYCGQEIKHCGWYPDTKMHLCRRNTVYWGGKNPHAVLLPNNESKIPHLKGDILHYSFDGLDDHLDRIKSYGIVSAKAKFKAGRKISKWLLVPNALFVFMKRYLFQGGFKDGFYGLVICVLSAYGKFIEQVKIVELHRQHPHKN